MFGTVDSSSRSVKTTILLFLFSLLLLNGCKDKTASNDCYYERVDTMAEVIDIRKSQSEEGRMEVILDFKASQLAFEDQEMGALKDVQIDQDFIDRNQIRIGNQYSVVVSEITKGNCVPRVVSFQHALE